MTTNSQEPLKLFYCYAHEDKTLRDELDVHLSGMKRLNLIKVWYDREILAGTDWEQEIDTHLSTAHIILLLVSARFLASDYYYGIEMQKALQRDTAGTARVVPSSSALLIGRTLHSVTSKPCQQGRNLSHVGPITTMHSRILLERFVGLSKHYRFP